MMFNSYERNGVFHGLSCTRENIFCFFGSRFTSREDLPRLFPQFEFSFATQVHGCAVAEGLNQASPQVDALWTSNPMNAVVIQTADCLPILLCSKTVVCGIHAGWRGVAKQIIRSVHQSLPEFNPTHAWIGPHIQFASFEVDRDVAEQLCASAPAQSLLEDLRTDYGMQKSQINLDLLAKQQLNLEFGLSSTVAACGVDTVADNRFHSFRRDREQAGRQFSFVVINR